MTRPALALASTTLLVCLAFGRDGRADPPRQIAQAAPPAQPAAAQPIAQPAPPPPGYGAAPPGYGQPPPGYGQPPPGYAPPPGYYYQPPPGYYAGAPLPPPVPKERNSTGMMVTGIVLTGVGVVGLLSGAILYSAANTQQTYDSLDCISSEYCNYDDHEDEKVAGVALMIAGGAAIAVGIPLLVIGARKVPVRGGAGAPGQPEPRDRDDDEVETSLVISPRSTGLRMTF